MNKLTPLQLFAVMICGRAFSMMTYFPFDDDNASINMIAILITTLMQAVLVLPIIYLHKKAPGECVCTLALKKSRPVGIIITALYMTAFLTVGVFVIGNFAYFMDYFFGQISSRVMVVICCTLGAVYIAHLNTGAIGKTFLLGAVLFVIFTAATVMGSFHHFSFVNFNLAVDNVGGSLISAVRREFVLNWDLVLFIFLLPNLKGSATKTAVWYLVTKLVISEVIMMFITVILGDYGIISKLSFFSLSAYAHTGFIERFDAAFMSLWVIMALLKLAIYVHCAAMCLKMIIPKMPFVTSSIVCGVMPAVVSLFLLVPYKWKNAADFEGGMWVQILLYTVLPLIMIIIKKKEGKNEGS